uniref:HAT C-terminal dimerisation domain-containing protein n=1 Tax=Salarias fasciatus TaxID=181472 RepID=A0A672IPK0_SALFA
KRKGSLSVHEGPSTSKQQKLAVADTKASQKSTDVAVMKFVVQGLHPFGVVEQPGFISLMQHIQPNYTEMSRTTLREKIEKNTVQMKAKVKNAMQNIKYISTTTDCWTAHRQSFIGVTAHWIEPQSLKRCSAALACRRLKGSHTYDVLAEALNDIHAEYNIREKIVRTTTDNASNFIKVFRVHGCDEESPAEGVPEEDPEVERQAVEFCFNLISTTDAQNANSNDICKKISRAAFAKCSSLWNRTSRSSTAAEVIERECKLQLIRPMDTRWTSLCLSRGEGAIRAVTTALNIWQAEEDVHTGWLVPTLTLLNVKLDRLKNSSKFCQPLITALQEGIQQRFGHMLSDPELVPAAILLLKFRTSWTSNADVLKLGMDYIKAHMDLDPVPSPGSYSGSEEEDFFGVMKGNVQEATRQLDTFLASSATSMNVLKSAPSVLNLSLKLNTPLPASAACEPPGAAFYHATR